MQLKDLCKGVYKSCPSLTSHEKFIDALFTAAGGNLYLSPSYKKQFYSGDKQLTENQKSSLRGRDNISSLTEFFETNISDGQSSVVIAAFGVPEKAAPNKKALAAALALQARAIFNSDEDEVDDIIAMEYQKALSEPSTSSPQQALTPLYPGDSAWTEFKPHQTYAVECYEKIVHTWIIHNTGNQTWYGRKLVFSNQDRVRPRAEATSIDIPDTLPNQIIRIVANIDARHIEGKFDCEWVMQDADGIDCFPNSRRMFYIYIETIYKPQNK